MPSVVILLTNGEQEGEWIRTIFLLFSFVICIYSGKLDAVSRFTVNLYGTENRKVSGSVLFFLCFFSLVICTIYSGKLDAVVLVLSYSSLQP